MKNPGLYIITNRIDTFQYVGKDQNLPTRIRNHFSGNTPNCKHIHRAIMKYGKDAFDVEIIRYPNISPEALAEVERWKIRQLDSFHNGYNCTEGGEGMPGHKHSKESRAKMSKANSGENNPMYGKTHSESTLDKMSEVKKGKKFSEKHRHNLSQARIGKTHSKITLNKMSKTQKKIGNKPPSQKGKKFSEQHKRNMSKSHKGKTFSDEALRNMSEAQKLPEYHTAHKFFASLSVSVDERRKLLYQKFPNVKKKTIQKWIHQWQSDLTN